MEAAAVEPLAEPQLIHLHDVFASARGAQADHHEARNRVEEYDENAANIYQAPRQATGPSEEAIVQGEERQLDEHGAECE